MNVEIETKRTIVEKKGRVPFVKKEERTLEESARSLDVGQATHIETPLGTLMMAEEFIEASHKKALYVELRVGDRKTLVTKSDKENTLDAGRAYLLTYPEDAQITYKVEHPNTEVTVTLLDEGPYETSGVAARLIPPRPSLEAAVALQIPRD